MRNAVALSTASIKYSRAGPRRTSSPMVLFLVSKARDQQQSPTLASIRRELATDDDYESATPSATIVSAPKETAVTFTSLPQSVYIEDSDSYGVMYHSNYLRAYDRALQQFHAQDSFATTTPTRSLAWSMVKVLQHRFKSSPPLGGLFCITGTRNDNDMLTAATSFPSATLEVWDMSMWNANNPTEVYNTATVILGRHVKNEPIE